MENRNTRPAATSLSAKESEESKDSSSPQFEIDALFENAPFPLALIIGREMLITRANSEAIASWGKGDGVVGGYFKEVFSEFIGQDIIRQMEEVFDTGIAYLHPKKSVPLEGKEQPNGYSLTPLFNPNGKVYGLMYTAKEVSEPKRISHPSEFSEQNFRDMVLQAPVAMSLLRGPEFVIELVNEAMLAIWGRSLAEVTGKPVFEALPDAKEQGLEQVMMDVYLTGKPYFANETPVRLTRNGKQDIIYQNFVYQAYRDPFGAILGVLAISVDVSEQVNARIELEKAYEQIHLSKTAAQLGTFDLDLEKGTMDWDDRCRQLFGISHTETVTYEKDFTAGLHPEDKERIIGVINDLLSGKKPDGDYDVEYRTVGQKDYQIRWIRAKGKVYYDQGVPKRFIGSVLDITVQKENELRLMELAQKQSQLAAVVNSSDEIIISKNLEGIITTWNPAAEREFGFTEAEAIGCHISIIIPKDRLKEEDYIIGQIKGGKKIHSFETVRQHKNKEEIQLSITVSPVFDQHGKVVGASKIARNISRQLQAQVIAKNYTERLEIMNMVMSSISEELDLNKILQKVTDATTEITGAQFGAFFYNKTDKRGESYTLFTLSGAPREAFEKFGMPRNTAVFHPTFSGERVMRVDDITKDPRYGKNDPHFGMPKGHLPVVSYLAVPVISRSGTVIGGLFFGHPKPGKFTPEHETLVISIAAQTAISLDNAKLFEEVKALNDKKDEFIGLASHELKTPLSSINGYLQILNRQLRDEGPKKFLSKALIQVSRITSLVNDLLDVSKIEAGKLQLTSANFDLKQVIEESIELCQHESLSHTIYFQTEKTECIVKGDAQRIEQVIVNLLNNAIKYAPKANRVEVGLECRTEKIMISVKDYGPGIAEDKLKYIFNRFYRIDEASPNISGLGIGLYLSHEIISRHRGEIWAESELGKGSTFYFSLPREKESI